jgi:hypothetical protein
MATVSSFMFAPIWQQYAMIDTYPALKVSATDKSGEFSGN